MIVMHYYQKVSVIEGPEPELDCLAAFNDIA